uniref:Uncharacterized protein LOC101512872 n=1 Tax=Cicer arietinum TaxID=3827 RepID=A0A1S2YLE8_CICAR|nr:uncharacterized protein LOC101512872 [Cicer arietinum]
MGPLVQVLILIDNEKKPAMGYIYAAMVKANEDIRKTSNEQAIEWWKTYGAQTPLLQVLAIKVLSLTCSLQDVSIPSKKRSRIEDKKLEDLVFVKYNQTLKERYDYRDVIDPIVLNDDDDYINEFEVGDLGEHGEPIEELVYVSDNLTWTNVANASGANELMVYTTRASKEKAVASASKAIAQEAISKEVVVEEDVEEVEPIYVEDDGKEETEEYIEVDGEYEEEEEEEDYVEDDGKEETEEYIEVDGEYEEEEEEEDYVEDDDDL